MNRKPAVSALRNAEYFAATLLEEMKGDGADCSHKDCRHTGRELYMDACVDYAVTRPCKASVMAVVSLHRLSELQRYDLYATDGKIGPLEDVYFDDATWTVRYMVAKAGNWLTGRRALISTVAIGGIDEKKSEIYVELSREQIKDSPPLDSKKPVSRQYEADYFRYYGWPPYWETVPFSPPLPSVVQAMPPMSEERSHRWEDRHLRSSREVTGYTISASDGEIGHVADFVIDEKNSKLCYLEVDTRNWWPGKHVLLNPAWIAQIDWLNKSVVVDLRRDDIRSAPEYDPKSVIGRDYEIKLFEHYARRKYWE
jgi:sporulation protein YlmC with PRC-barrel domain